MSSMLQEAKAAMRVTPCDCGSTDFELDPISYDTSCRQCGALVAESASLNIQFTKTTEGDLAKVGTTIHMGSNKVLHEMHDAPILSSGNNLERNEIKFKKRIDYIISILGEDHDDIPQAKQRAIEIWKICFEKQLTRGYESNQLAAILFYMACRQCKLPYLLLDFAGLLRVNVYKLAKKFSKLCLDIPIEIETMSDPSIYMSRFVNQLGFGDKSQDVINSACKVVSQMKNDWIITGRRPAGIVGACIYIAARIEGVPRSIKDIVRVVNLSETTIEKRVREFLDTDACKNMTVREIKDTSIQSIKEKGKTTASVEKPPVVKQQERREIKTQQKQESIKKKEEQIEKCIKQFAEHENIKNDQDNAEDEHIIDSLLKTEPVRFVRATDPDELESNDNHNHNHHDLQSEGDASFSSIPDQPTDSVPFQSNTEHESENDEDDDLFVQTNDDNSNQNMFAFNSRELSVVQALKSQFDQTINSRTDSNHNSQSSATNRNSNSMNGSLFITNANVHQLDEGDDALQHDYTYDDEGEDDYDAYSDHEQAETVKEERLKYHEENDLSYLDTDPTVSSMILSADEIKAKQRMFATINPDWKKVKDDIDRRAMIKEEKEQRKRKFEQLYKRDPYSYLSEKCSKRFKSCSKDYDLEAFYKLTGQAPTGKIKSKSPSFDIKKQDPMAMSSVNEGSEFTAFSYATSNNLSSSVIMGEFKLSHVNGDLFESPGDCALCHCVSHDFAMSKGIAQRFKEKFDGVEELKEQKKNVGECAVLYREKRYVYYLITKEKYWQKPSYKTLTEALQDMKRHAVENNVLKIAMPRIGCGLDQLKWSRIEKIIRDTFVETDITITVYEL